MISWIQIFLHHLPLLILCRGDHGVSVGVAVVDQGVLGVLHVRCTSVGDESVCPTLALSSIVHVAGVYIPFVVEGSSEPGGGLGSPGWRLGSAQGFGSLTQQRRGQSGGRPRPVEVDTGHIETVAWLQRLSGN